MIEKYAYNGLIGAMKPAGDGFSYVNLLNGVKTNPEGWGGMVDSVYVTCCNLNGPMGLAYLPFVAVMNSNKGPVINLYNAAVATAQAPGGKDVKLEIRTDFPLSGKVSILVTPQKPGKFSLRLRIPSWSKDTRLVINGDPIVALPGTYADINRKWTGGDQVELLLDMRCRVMDAPKGSNRKGDHFQALVMGPVVLARDENIDPDFDRPVTIISKEGYVDIKSEAPVLKTTKMQFLVPTSEGMIRMTDYASVDSWNGEKICTWFPKE
jgi:hypothetical protein